MTKVKFLGRTAGEWVTHDTTTLTVPEASKWNVSVVPSDAQKAALVRFRDDGVVLFDNLTIDDAGAVHQKPAVECAHTYQTYLGFTDTYKFCTKCDHKEKLK
jgi:hypothetical protein